MVWTRFIGSRYRSVMGSYEHDNTSMPKCRDQSKVVQKWGRKKGDTDIGEAILRQQQTVEEVLLNYGRPRWKCQWRMMGWHIFMITWHRGYSQYSSTKCIATAVILHQHSIWAADCRKHCEISPHIPCICWIVHSSSIVYHYIFSAAVVNWI
jgi:hypothetical protein